MSDENEKAKATILGWMLLIGCVMFLLALGLHNWIAFAIGAVLFAFVAVVLFEPQWEDNDNNDDT